jgi:hypothetical protein
LSLQPQPPHLAFAYALLTNRKPQLLYLQTESLSCSQISSGFLCLHLDISFPLYSYSQILPILQCLDYTFIMILSFLILQNKNYFSSMPFIICNMCYKTVLLTSTSAFAQPDLAYSKLLLSLGVMLESSSFTFTPYLNHRTNSVLLEHL